MTTSPNPDTSASGYMIRVSALHRVESWILERLDALKWRAIFLSSLRERHHEVLLSAQSPPAHHAGSSAKFVIVAKDVKGVRKSLGGDIFKASWLRVGSSEPAISARVRHTRHLS
jgi:hypothetical protein